MGSAYGLNNRHSPPTDRPAKLVGSLVLPAQIWRDSVCGDGICDTFENVSWGLDSNRHGCEVDCTAIPHLTKVTVTLDYTGVLEGK